VTAAAGSGGLDVRLGRWQRPPRAPSRPNLARPPPPFLAGGQEGCPHKAMARRRSPASGAVERRRQLLQARRRPARRGSEGLRVDFPVEEEFFLQKSYDLHDLNRPCARSDGREKRVTWPRWPAIFCCVNRIVKINQLGLLAIEERLVQQQVPA